MPIAVIRTDGGSAIGRGHVARCLTLAEALHAPGWRWVFVMQGGPGAGPLLDLAHQEGHRVVSL